MQPPGMDKHLVASVYPNRSYGVLVWEVITFGETPHKEYITADIVEMANYGTLQLNW